ncbi:MULTISPECIES: hypothetical protein [unclassified Microcoleus]|uniref:hypothetical protein n=1 Tax=unclassified Microcoleus TaxID=2642155 RepID=UPI0025FC990C|nr:MULTISPECIES: hypothetical protein [unclassified Microcoleus]
MGESTNGELSHRQRLFDRHYYSITFLDIAGMAQGRKILKQAVLEFLVHGLRYVFYAQPGSLSRGLPTAHSAEPLQSKLVCFTI